MKVRHEVRQRAQFVAKRVDQSAIVATPPPVACLAQLAQRFQEMVFALVRGAGSGLHADEVSLVA
jgi:hypothetical protein